MVVPYPEFVELGAHAQSLLGRHPTPLLEVSPLGFLVAGEHSNLVAHLCVLPGKGLTTKLETAPLPIAASSAFRGGAAVYAEAAFEGRPSPTRCATAAGYASNQPIPSPTGVLPKPALRGYDERGHRVGLEPAVQALG